MIFDYITLKLIWWGLICTLFVGFAITGGMDFGVAILLPFVGKSDDERRLILNSIGPTWEGNQVWLITAAGTTFAAWPLVYATAFSSMYFALLIVLIALILRPPGFDYRSKLPAVAWRKTWDWCLFASGVIPTLMFGVSIGNLLLGIPFYFDENLRIYPSGGLFDLLSPFTLVFGLINLSIVIIQGGLFLQLKLDCAVVFRVKLALQIFTALFLLSFFMAVLWTGLWIDGMQIVSAPDLQSSFMPVAKAVAVGQGIWGYNYAQHHELWLLPASSIICMLTALYCSAKDRPGIGLLFSSAGMLSVIFTVAVALFPFIIPSSIQPNHSLTIWDAVSSHKTLQLMFWAIALLLPIVLSYIVWVYKVMSGKITVDNGLSDNEAY